VPTLDRDGVRIHHDASGDPGAPAVVLSHGYSSTGAAWATTVAALSPPYRCLTWDERGHGESDSPDDPAAYSIELAVGDLLAVLDAEGVDRAVLVGHSLGGYLSLRFHARHPERVAALVLVDTGPGYRNPEARAGWNELCERYAKGFEERGLDALGRSPEVAMVRHRSATGLVHAARGTLTQHDALVVDHLPAIDVPTLIVVGSEDTPFLTGCDVMAKKIPGARLVTVDGAGHAPMLTHAATFQAEVRAFLDGLALG
jgi:pimeloyl-ACP methyl ester carboxylesterase